MKERLCFIFIILIFLTSCSDALTPIEKKRDSQQFSFVVTADIRGYTGDNRYFFRGACESIDSVGPGSFMISPGDIDPPADVLSTIEAYINEDYIWYPVVGNHEAETPGDMSWLRNYNPGGDSLPNVVNVGPPGCVETSYSFDYGNAHFAVINEYYDGSSDHGTDGDVVDALHNWLVSDLTANQKPITFVFGHEPAYPQPDEESGRLRHENDSLNKYPANRDRFWSTLSDHGVLAYICGHTHNYSIVNINDVWQIDTGHARGMGDQGARSTYILFNVSGNGSVFYNTYRLDLSSGEYVVTDSDTLQ